MSDIDNLNGPHSVIDTSLHGLFDNVPVDVVNYIMRFLSTKDKYANDFSGKRVPALGWQKGIFRGSFYQARLVCKKWNKASQMCIPIWISILAERGPKQIRPESKHNPYFLNRATCNYNSAGKCIVAMHYPPMELVGKFSKDTAPFAAYKEVMKLMGRKFKTTLTSQLNASKKHKKRCLEKVTLLNNYIGRTNQDISLLEKRIESNTEHYKTFTKRQKKNLLTE